MRPRKQVPWTVWSFPTIALSSSHTGLCKPNQISTASQCCQYQHLCEQNGWTTERNRGKCGEGVCITARERCRGIPAVTLISTDPVWKGLSKSKLQCHMDVTVSVQSPDKHCSRFEAGFPTTETACSLCHWITGRYKLRCVDSALKPQSFYFVSPLAN
jgi:hypothetical protein